MSPCRLVSPVPGFVTLMPYASATYTVWASRRSYTYSEGPPDLGVPEKLTFRWNHAYLVQNCAKNAIQRESFGKSVRPIASFELPVRYMYVCVCVHRYMYVYIYLYINSMYVYIHTYIHVHTHTHTQVRDLDACFVWADVGICSVHGRAGCRTEESGSS